MSNKGNQLSLATKMAIGTANAKNRAIVDKKALDYIKQLSKGDLPSVTACAIYIGINEKNLVAYEMGTEEGSKIRLILGTVRDKQKLALMERGLNRKYDSRLSAMLLERLHGMRETPKLEQTNIFNVPPEILAEAIALSHKKDIKGEEV